MRVRTKPEVFQLLTRSLFTLLAVTRDWSLLWLLLHIALAAHFLLPFFLICNERVESQQRVTVHRVHKWRSVKIKYCFRSAAPFFTLYHSLLLKIHVFEVVGTPILVVVVGGAHQLGDTGTRVVLPFAWVGYLQVEENRGRRRMRRRRVNLTV